MIMKKLLIGTTVILALALGSMAKSDSPSLNDLDIKAFVESTNVDDVLNHLQAFKSISEQTGNTREAGTAGYDLSSNYVAMKLISAGYQVTLQPFEFDKYEVVTPSEFSQTLPAQETYKEEETFNTMSYSPSGSVTAQVVAVDIALGDGNTTTSACELEDFKGFPAGQIALVQRGTCNFRQKAENAEKAGASGVVVFNQGDSASRKELFNGTLGKGPLNIPVFTVSYDLGVKLSAAGTVLRMKADTLATTTMTHNLIAESNTGDPNNVVMVGAHLDSVGAGPGINDNGSGSAAVLDVALKLSTLKLNNKLRFAWWGAEEHGLVGSRHYTSLLTEADAKKIALYLNFDMIGSPNFIFGIYDADGSKFNVAGPKGSASIEKLFHDYFAAKGRKTIEVEANGRSDYVGFAEKGIPFGGSFTGAENAKTAEQVAMFGGKLGEAYDPCYHKACDTMENISLEALEMNHRMIVYAALSYARSTVDVDKEKSAVTLQNLAVRFDPNQYPEHYSCHADAVWAK